MRERHWLDAGTAVPVVFFTTTVLCGLVQGNYNHLSRQVSELGTIGTNSQYLFAAGLVLSSFLSILFIAWLLGACRRLQLSVWPVWPMFAFSVSIAGAAMFPLPLRMHQIMGSPVFLLLLSPLLGLILWPKNRLAANIRWMSVLSLLIMALGFLAYFPDILASYPGLKQRFFHAGWAIWFVYLSRAFRRALENQRIEAGRP
ncbi:MAG: DUF998 domain-containing protein [Candidatus Aminicenantes bacterium]|nr:DUF998 domain-containing protein [Candidatus Aminicenantes bacterium]